MAPPRGVLADLTSAIDRASAWLAQQDFAGTAPQQRYAAVLAACVRLRADTADAAAKADLLAARNGDGYWSAGGATVADDVEITGCALGGVSAPVHTAAQWRRRVSPSLATKDPNCRFEASSDSESQQ